MTDTNSTVDTLITRENELYYLYLQQKEKLLLLPILKQRMMQILTKVLILMHMLRNRTFLMVQQQFLQQMRQC